MRIPDDVLGGIILCPGIVVGGLLILSIAVSLILLFRKK